MRTTKAVATTVCVLIFGVLGGAFGDSSMVARPGALGGGVTLLPNGWKIAPAGRHVQVGSFPMAMTESPDGRTLFVASNGYLRPAVIAVDIKSQRVIDTLVLDLQRSPVLSQQRLELGLATSRQTDVLR